MRSLYTAFQTIINGKTFYIVKNYRTYPEHLDVSPVLEKYGMHIDFYQACKIAMLYDKEIQQQLLYKLENKSATANVYPAVAEIYYSRNEPPAFPVILNLAGTA